MIETILLGLSAAKKDSSMARVMIEAGSANKQNKPARIPNPVPSAERIPINRKPIKKIPINLKKGATEPSKQFSNVGASMSPLAVVRKQAKQYSIIMMVGMMASNDKENKADRAEARTMTTIAAKELG